MQLSSGRYYLLKPQTEALRGRKTLILDVDETLVHSQFKPAATNVDFELTINISNIPNQVMN